MRLTLLSTFLIAGKLTLFAESPLELQTTGDQLYEDGFLSLAWSKYKNAYNIAKTDEQKLELLLRMSKTAIQSNKQNETLSYLAKFIADKNIDISKKYETILESALLHQNIAKYKEAAENCILLLKQKSLPKKIQLKALESVVFSLIKNSKLEDASKIIEKYQDLFPEPDKIQLQNARIKILLGQFVSSLSILGKFAESKAPLPQFLSLWAYMKSGDTDKAHEIYLKHLKDITAPPDPAFTNILIKLAESTFKDKIDSATALLDKAYAIEFNPDMKAYILLKKAELHIQADLNENAIQTLEEYTKSFPESNKILQAQLQLADLYYGSEKQDLTKAATFLNTIIDSNTQDKKMLYSALVLRAEVKQAVGTLVDSSGDFTAAAELAGKEKFSADEIAYPLYRAGLVKYLEADKIDLKEAFNDAANSFYSSGSIKSSYRIKAALMQIQSLRRAESYTIAAQAVKQWLKIFPKNSDLKYLLGISLIEDNKTNAGIKALKQFINLNKTDQRVPMSYVYALNASIYNPDSAKMVKESEMLVIDFEQEAKTNKALAQGFKLAAPYIQHLKAVFAWKNNYRVIAESLWNNFLKEHPSHPLSAEVYLWLAFKARESENKNFNEAISKYDAALAMLQESSLKAYTLIQRGKSYKNEFQFSQALESLEAAIAVYRKLKPADSQNEEFSSLLFYAGDLYSRISLYEDKAVPLFQDAEKLTSDLNIKNALKGRIADCYFASASKVSGQDEFIEEYQEKIEKALSIYKEVSLDSNSSPAIAEQALYKLAKCHESLGNLKEKTHQNKHLDDARRYYEKLFFAFQNDFEKGKLRDSYFFCRTGYDLARLHLNFEEQGLLPAVTTYRILAKSGLPGTHEAKLMVELLSEIQRKTDQ